MTKHNLIGQSNQDPGTNLSDHNFKTSAQFSRWVSPVPLTRFFEEPLLVVRCGMLHSNPKRPNPTTAPFNPLCVLLCLRRPYALAHYQHRLQSSRRCQPRIASGLLLWGSGRATRFPVGRNAFTARSQPRAQTILVPPRRCRQWRSRSFQTSGWLAKMYLAHNEVGSTNLR